MPDPRFFNFQGPVTLGELADIIGAELQHQESATFSINGVSSLNDIVRLSDEYSNGIEGVIIGRALYDKKFTFVEAINKINKAKI